MTTIAAKSILASKHALDHTKRLDTLLLRYPRCIHAELMTHRMFSRNAASSRAIPVEKMIQSVMNEPFIPVHWGKNQKGMQASEECDVAVYGYDNNETYRMLDREQAWLGARDQAVKAARAFSAAGYHKQIVNRLIEPFMHITVLVSSTNWSNWRALRDHGDAEPHIMLLAREMTKALDGATVQTLNPGESHLPFITDDEKLQLIHENQIKLSVARCASTSYKTVEGFDMTFDRAEAIYDKLYTMRPAHASPFEHIAEADDLRPERGITNSETTHLFWKQPHLGGNLRGGWIQFRKTLPGECL